MSARISLLLTSTILVSGWQLPLKAQTADPLIYTVGKVFAADSGPHAYILWQPGNPATTYGKEFAVYRKEGNSASLAPYSRLGRTKLQNGPGAIHALLKLGGRFDFNADSVANRINTLYAESTSQPGTQPPAPGEPGMDEARKLAYLLKIAAGDEKILERIAFLGRAHPGVYMSMGHAFSIKTNAGSVQTYEVRETDTAGNDLRVIGRVTLDADNPTGLTRTSRPFEVFYAPKTGQQEVTSPRNHLVTRMRWGTPNDLRRLLPHSFGFNLYRVREAVAISEGWHDPASFPDASVLEAMVQSSLASNNPNAKRVNSLPIIATALMTAGEAEDTETDSETFFVHDNNDSPENPFSDGDTFYYFVAARDIAGHPGPVSAGTKVVICDRLPPTVPVIESVRNVFEKDTVENLISLKGNQHFKVRIRQTANDPAENAADKYYIYRWSDHTQHIREGGDPLTNRVGEIDHDPAKQYVDWEDTGPGAPQVTPADESQLGQTWWYTLRAADNSACSVDNLSGHSPPAFGVLRDRAGPGKPSGILTRCRYLPTVTCKEPLTEKVTGLGLPLDFRGFVIRLTRNDKLVKGGDIRLLKLKAGGTTVTELFNTTRFFSVPARIDVPLPFATDRLAGTQLQVRCRSISGLMSDWVTCDLSSIPPPETTTHVYPVELDVQKSCFPVIGQETHPPHEVDGPSGSIVGPELTVTLPEGTAEYRIYRRVGHDGAFELIAQGFEGGEITVFDTAPPTAGNTEVCYFAQVFDSDGNAGPRTKIGCITIKSGNLGTPMLAEATYLSENAGQAQLRLDWFCDPVGVERFEIWAASDSTGDPQLTSVLIGPKLIGPKLGDLNGAISGTNVEELTFSGYQTKTLNSGQIGNGAEFSVSLNVPSSQTLTFAVRAVGKGTYQDPAGSDEARPSGLFSNTVTANWKPPVIENQDIIPWPALAVPNVADVQLNVVNYQKGEGPFYASALPAGDSASASILIGAFKSFMKEDHKDPFISHIDKDTDPLSLLFSFRKQNIHPAPENQIQSIAPFVIYRHQLPTEAKPDIVPNLIQVSPLIDRIAYKDHAGGLAAEGYREIRDPFFRFKGINADIAGGGAYQVPVEGTFCRDLQGTVLGIPAQYPDTEYLKDCDTLMCWIDPMPVAKGARYQYLIVHFTQRGEIDRVIPTNYVDQP
jgi:hypothetical protein